MSKIISDLLQIDTGNYREFVERLENATLRPGVDVRLGVEVVARVHAKVDSLGLDASDTTAKELYFGLRHKLVADDKKLVAKLKLVDGQVQHNSDAIAQICSTLSCRELSLSMTSAGTKRILKAVPPKRTLKLLKYRSLDSVLKRHDPRVFYALACLVENDSWHAQAYAAIRRLNAKDVQWQPVTCADVPQLWYERLFDVLSKAGALVINEEAGIVCILPVVAVEKPGSTILLSGLVLQAASHIVTQSIPYRRYALSQGYANILPRIAIADHPVLTSIHGLSPTWRAVHELFGSGTLTLGTYESEFEVFDLYWEHTEVKLASLVPEMDFWVGTHYLGARASSGKPVSLHVLDVAIAVVSDAEFGVRPSTHMRSSLWNELHLRYLSEDVLSRILLRQISELERSVIG